MIRRSTFIVSLVGVTALAFIPKATALPPTQLVQFAGSVSGSCVFSNTTSGVLVQPSPSAEWVEASGGIPGFSNGTSGTTIVNCTNGGQLTTGYPTVVNAPAAFNPNILQAIVYDGNNFTRNSSTGGTFDTGSWAQGSTAALNIPPQTNVNLKVGLISGKNANSSGVPSGNYLYNVQLTATPN